MPGTPAAGDNKAAGSIVRREQSQTAFGIPATDRPKLNLMEGLWHWQ
jgi:hypothetical protein